MNLNEYLACEFKLTYLDDTAAELRIYDKKELAPGVIVGLEGLFVVIGDQSFKITECYPNEGVLRLAVVGMR